MGQKTHPYGLRVGITEPHKSRWYAPKALYGELLVEDEKIRRFLDKRLNRRPPSAAVSDVHIERTREELKVIIKTARPGLVIGPKGAEVDRMTEELQLMTGRKVKISIIEVKNPDLDAKLVRAIRESAFYFIQKPFDREVLTTLVERCLELRRQPVGQAQVRAGCGPQESDQKQGWCYQFWDLPREKSAQRKKPIPTPPRQCRLPLQRRRAGGERHGCQGHLE